MNLKMRKSLIILRFMGRETGVATLENRALQLQSQLPHAFGEVQTTRRIDFTLVRQMFPPLLRERAGVRADVSQIRL
jgi:hypothetical protein